MHELGIVFSVMDSLEEVARENDVESIHSVTIQIGEVSAVIPYYLTDCWDWARKKRELLADCEMKVEIIPGVSYCEDCEKDYPTVEYGKTCPHCGSANTYLKMGNEINIKEVEVF